eukprot:511774-Rhodomonas_salina.1
MQSGGGQAPKMFSTPEDEEFEAAASEALLQQQQAGGWEVWSAQHMTRSLSFSAHLPAHRRPRRLGQGPSLNEGQGEDGHGYCAANAPLAQGQQPARVTVSFR